MEEAHSGLNSITIQSIAYKQLKGESNASSGGGVYLGDAYGAEPVSIGHICNLGSEAEHVTATVTTVTEQQVLVIIPLMTHLTRLRWYTETTDTQLRRVERNDTLKRSPQLDVLCFSSIIPLPL